MKISTGGEHTIPASFLEERKNPNGLYCDRKTNRMVFTEMFTEVSRFDPETREVETVLGKTRMLEAYDDICMDSSGNYWITDPPSGFIKKYNPQKGEVVRYKVKGIGQTSSCGIREENGEEIIYVTELRKSTGKFLSRNFDGRGVVSIPLKELIEKADTI